ncbi:MAG: pyruvate dehydrogenase (acetyl-transferring) E1 component subunit alpha [Deltaproteobacteria bacterium RIFCSPHIGHO2_02_FULL_40_11]|nr:MAG: pyruvate dehydrogenase (acetyl-transferring) E1 component subunit alpha [Deltaproteobacteria bacterium RIFCSPHIGHO2_02_FULL_40_11]
MPRNHMELDQIDTLSVLSEDGSIDKSQLPKLSKEELLKSYRFLVLTRRTDEQALRYQRQGRIGTFAPSTGQEASQIGSAMAISKEDWFIPSFRELGVALCRGMSIRDYFLFIMGFEEANQGLKGTNNMPVSVPVGSQCAFTPGIAWGIKLDKKKAAAVVYFGDGATSEGDFHEGLNFCGALNLPAVYLCQNNQWAISTPRSQQTAAKSIAQKAIAYGVCGIQVDGNDFFAVYKATKEALDRAKKGEGPTLIECVTYRLSVHTTADDPTVYRAKEEEEAWQKKDPIERLRKYLEKEKLWDSSHQEKLEEDIKAEIKKGYEEAEQFRNSIPDPLKFFDHQYETIPPYLAWQKSMAKEKIQGRNVIKGATEGYKGPGGAAAVGELEEAGDE